MIGMNNHIAWGVTNVGADIQDLYIIEEEQVSAITTFRICIPYVIGSIDVLLCVWCSVLC